MERSTEMTNIDEAGMYTGLTNKIKQLEGVTHMIAHNLRGSSSNIKMLSEVLMRKKSVLNAQDDLYEDDEAFTTGEAVQYIYESSTALIATLNALMEVADVELNKDIKFDDCDIEKISMHIFYHLHSLIQLKSATITFDLGVKNIAYPAAYMENILYNFINNALKYSKSGVPLKIIVTTYDHKNKPVLSVADNGLGIDLDRYSGRIFKLNQVFHSGYESKGIGLYITKLQVESFGGTIEVKSKLAEGSEFIVNF